MTIKLVNSSAWKYTALAVFLFSASLFISCEKEIKLNLSTGDPALVVEGQIETGLPPFVMITKTFGFFSKVDLATLEGSFVHDALVTITDGSILDTLREYTLDSSGVKFSFYSIDTATLSNAILQGEVDKNYTLSISYGGKTYQATTKIPNVIPVDSFYADTVLPFRFPNTPTDAVALYINVKDPDTIGNYIRYYTKRNDEPYYPVDVVTAEDFGANGTYLRKIGIGFGYPRSVPDSSASVYPIKGDSITLKWCAIDKQVYDFWRTYSFAINVVGNPFASPTNIPSNFSNGALGVWAGYGSSTIAIQEYR
ncbi:MAG: DUF4249 domain-containing protein [Flavipsychrobacter sp.]|nr:DUF4249 domain-containing protein [Flavipsychrobacter sp.]